MSTEVTNADPKVVRIVDAIYGLNIELPVSERELVYTLDRVSRVCLEQIYADLTNSSAERRSEGLAHLMEHLNLTVSPEMPQTVSITPDEPEAPDEAPQIMDDSAKEPDLPSPSPEENGGIFDEILENEFHEPINLKECAPVASEPAPSTDSLQALPPVIESAVKPVKEVFMRDESKAYIDKDSQPCSHGNTTPAGTAITSSMHTAMGSGQHLVSHLSEISYLQNVRKDLGVYAKSKSQSERARLARSIIERLWEDRRMGSEIKELFSASDGFEQVLEMVSSRDHFAHQLETYLLGCLILGELEPELVKSGRIGILGKDSDSIGLTWLMTSSIHDAGYPLEYGRHIVDKLGSLYSRLGMDNYSRLFNSMDAELSGMAEQNLDVGNIGSARSYLNIPSLITSLIMKGAQADHDALSKIIEDKWTWQDHGLAGASILARALLASGKVKLNGDSAELTAFESASAAMALHNLGPDELMFAIDFDRLPYMFLLMMVNELYEWNHPSKDGYDLDPCFNLSSVEVARAAGRRVIKLSFIMQTEPDSGTLKALGDQLVAKRRKLSNLNYTPASQNCDEVEIRAVYQAGGEQLGAITVLLLHRV